MLLHPFPGLYYFSWISCGRQNLPDQWIRVQRDRRYELLQLFWALLRSLRRLPRAGCAGLISEPNASGIPLSCHKRPKTKSDPIVYTEVTV
jgi:hypothetical protein